MHRMPETGPRAPPGGGTVQGTGDVANCTAGKACSAAGASAPGSPPARRPFALAGAKRERRLPARHGPAPEVPPGPARVAPTCVYAGRGRADTVSGAPSATAWWDVPVADTATRPEGVRTS
ncbi:hypothetical protein GCM10023237_44730 [Streptomyces coeruleoprunus]